MTTSSFYQNVIDAIGSGTSREVARRATAAVFHALRDRLTPDEADQVAAQLPSELRETWEAGERAERRPVKMNREEFYERVGR